MRYSVHTVIESPTPATTLMSSGAKLWTENFLKVFLSSEFQPTFHAVFMTQIDPHKGICTGKTVYELWFMHV